MHVLIAEVELHVPSAASLKEKRSVLTSIIRNLDQMHGVAAAEVDHQDLWQRASIGVTVVGGDPTHVQSVMDHVDRYVWSRPDIDVLDISTVWWESD